MVLHKFTRRRSSEGGRRVIVKMKNIHKFANLTLSPKQNQSLIRVKVENNN